MQKSVNFNPKDLGLYLVVDRKNKTDLEIENFLNAVIPYGVSMIQIREKETSTRDFINFSLKVKSVIKNQIPLIINDRIDVALAIDADGVHLGQSDMPVSLARKIIGPKKILGLSIENENQLQEITNVEEIDYIGVGPIFETFTKLDAAPALGLSRLKKIRESTKLPIVAIGGIGLVSTPEIIQLGVEGVAVVSAINNSIDPKQTTIQFKNIIDRIRNE